jgi:hypothetical protein
MKKARRFDEGGGVRFAESDPDIYARARKAVVDRSIDDALKGEAPTPARRMAPRVSTTDTDLARESNRASMARDAAAQREIARLQEVDKPIERVTPEEYILPPLRGLRAAAAAKAASRPALDAAFNAAQRSGAAPTRRAMEAMVPSNRAAVEAAKRGDAAYQARTAAAEKMKDETRGRTARETMDYEGGPARAARSYTRPQKQAARDMDESRFADEGNPNFRKGGATKAFAKGGSVSSASKRADGIAQRGKTRGKYL